MLSKTFFRRNTDVFQGKMARRSVKRPAVRVRWEFSYYFLIKFFNQKGSAFGVTDSVILIKSRNLVS